MRSILLYLLLIAAPIATAAPQIRNLAAVATGGSVAVRFELVDAFDDPDVVRALQSGLPTAFEYEVEIYRERPYWIDQSFARSHIEVIATFNSITREYLLNVRRDRRLVRTETFSSLDALARRMTVIEEPALFDIGNRRPWKMRVRARADFGRTFLLYVIPASNSTNWRDVRVKTVEAKP